MQLLVNFIKKAHIIEGWFDWGKKHAVGMHVFDRKLTEFCFFCSTQRLYIDQSDAHDIAKEDISSFYLVRAFAHKPVFDDVIGLCWFIKWTIGKKKWKK